VTPSEPARIPPGDRKALGLRVWAFSRVAGRVTGTEPPAIFTTLGRNRRMFWGWLHFAGRLMPGGKLPRRESELVILRVAHLAGSAYEFEHHVRLGRRAGVSRADVDRVVAGSGATGWTARERALLTAVDELHQTRDVSDATWSELSAHLDDARLVELLMLVGHYEMLATTLHTLRVAPDRPRR
jgi:AhpD family alkylhydroperoxidase